MTDTSDRAALGVTRSAAGQVWSLRDVDDMQILAFSQRLGLPDILCRMLAGRNVPLEQAASYLDPKLRDLLPDPSLMAGMGMTS